MPISQPSPIFGVVLDPSGKPVPNARVSFTRGPVALPDIAAVSDPNGRFSLTAPAPGAYSILVNAAGFEMKEVDATVAGQDSKSLTVQLAPSK
jgi:uncharacterized GH25 family protein